MEIKRTILLVDDDNNLLKALSEFFEVFANMQSLCFQQLPDLMEHKASVLDSNIVLAILDINLGVDRPSGIDVYDWLCHIGFKGEIVFLTGHAKDHSLVKKVAQIKGIKILGKPMEIGELLSLVGGNNHS